MNSFLIRQTPLPLALLLSLLLTLGYCLNLFPKAQAQIFDNSSDAPIELDAQDGIDWQKDLNIYTARGDVIVRQETNELRTDELKAQMVTVDGSDKISTLHAKGTVILKGQEGQIKADRLDFNLLTGVAKAYGNPATAITPQGIIKGKELTYHTQENWILATGGAEVTRTGAKAQNERIKSLKAPTLKAYFSKASEGKTDLDKITNEGRVTIKTAQGDATADHIDYQRGKDLILLTGNVVLKENQNYIKGDRATLNTVTGYARMDGAPARAHIIPKTLKKN